MDRKEVTEGGLKFSVPFVIMQILYIVVGLFGWFVGHNNPLIRSQMGELSSYRLTEFVPKFWRQK